MIDINISFNALRHLLGKCVTGVKIIAFETLHSAVALVTPGHTHSFNILII